MKSTPQNSTRIILILGALATVSPFAIDMYLPAFALIAQDFETTPARISLSVTSYFIGMAIGQIMYGPLLDRFGRKWPLYVGLSLFVITCVACSQARSIEALIVLRFFQSLSGCVAWVAAMAMARDFFPVEQSAKVFSLLVLVIGLSPLLAPTAGGFIAEQLSWPWVFIALAALVFIILVIAIFFLPEAQKPDHSVSLRVKPMLLTFYSVLKQPQFFTYSLSGAFAFASLFIYVAGSPIIFIERFKVTPQIYGAIFALLSVGFIGGSQLNILINKHYSSEKIFQSALYVLVATCTLFAVGSWYQWFGFEATLVIFFIVLTCLGLTNPNATALSLAPFSRNVGSASALLGFLQIGVAGLASACIGVLNSTDSFPVAMIMASTSVVSFVILRYGRKKIRIMQIAIADSPTVAH